MLTDSTLTDRQPVNNMRWGGDGFRNEIMFDVTSSFSLNFGHVVEKLGGEQLCQAQNYTRGGKNNINTKGEEACVLSHDI